jgi:uncharacterized membrane protein
MGGRIGNFIGRPENLFTTFALFFGLLFCFLTGPFQAPDEFVHYFRAYSLSEGNCVGYVGAGKLPSFAMGHLSEHRFNIPYSQGKMYGYSLPFSLFEAARSFQYLQHNPGNKVDPAVVRDLLDNPLYPERRIFFQTSVFLPVNYIPQAAGIFIGRLFKLSPLALLYCGRVANLLVWILLIRGAISLSPILKWVLGVIALLPISLFLASSLSYDAFTNAICFSLIALILNMAFDEQRLGAKDWFMLLIVSLSVALSKYVYVALLLAYFIIPAWKAGGRRRYFLFFFIILGVDLLASGSWFHHFEWQKHISSSSGLSPNIAYALEQPVQLGASYLQAFRDFGLQWVRHFFGVLGWLDIPLPFYLQLYSGFMLLVVCLYDHNPEIALNLRQKVVLAMPTLAVLLLAGVALYLTYNQAGAKAIEGIQGRYFIPIAPLVGALFYNRKLKLQNPQAFIHRMLPLYFTVSLAGSAWLILRRYYSI